MIEEAVPAGRQEKVNQIEELAKEAAESGAVVFSDYSGLTVTEMSELRKKLAAIGADLRVVKNTLLVLALEKADLKDGELKGPTAALFSRSADPIESIKVLVSYLKEKAKGEVKFGFFEKNQTAAARLMELAVLPGKLVLQDQLVSQLSAPIYKLAYVLSVQQKKLVVILDAISKTKGGVANG
jgi:large subunit ribosomal protein L10